MLKIKQILIIFILLLISSDYIISQTTYKKLALTKQDSAQIIKYTENYEIYISKNDLRNSSDFLNQIAEVYWKHNHFEKSADYYLQSLKLNEKLGNENGMAGIHSNLGMIYSDLGQYQKSVDHLMQAVAKRRKEKNTISGRENLFNSLLNLASALKQLGRYNEAIKYLKEALNYAQEINNLEKIAIFYLQLAEVNESAGNQAEAKNYTEKYMTFYKQMQDEEVSKSHIAMENERLKSEQISLENRLKEMELQEKTVELEQKVIEVKKYVSKADSLANTLSKEQLAKKLIEQQAEQERLNQQKRLILLGSVFSIVSIIAILLYYAFRQKKKANIELENKNKEILRQQDEIIAHRDLLNIKNKELDKKNNQITESIKYAKLIQTAILEREMGLNEYIPESFILFKPKDIVSGDFYWYTETNNKLLIATIDCTGHGVPGAFMSLIGANILNQIVLNNKITEPNEILEELHIGVNIALNQKHTGNDDGMDASIFVIDKKRKILSYAGAQNPLIIIKDDKLEEIEADDISIGGPYREQNNEFTKKEIKLKGDTYIYSFSDGYQDQFGGTNDKKFMLNRLKKLFMDNHKKDMNEQKEILNNTIENWKRESRTKQTDDILIIGLHLKF
ncbi:MAG: tetratricopeptide repeat protein [Bacteroidales bacterium]|nr:tetratricopeptide repeat protein [Bacteroidales bacterium]